uniref:Uncharacterized protein n=1 Tax=Arion vulgaris TaxID=1028688 RepID=A0A0B7BCR4_9EUPU
MHLYEIAIVAGCRSVYRLFLNRLKARFRASLVAEFEQCWREIIGSILLNIPLTKSPVVAPQL